MAAQVVLSRQLALKDHAPFVLITDSLRQLGRYLQAEIAAKFSGHVLFLMFESLTAPPWALEALDCSDRPPADVVAHAQAISGPALVVVDSLNYLPRSQLAQFVAGLALRKTTVLATFHRDCPLGGVPGALPLLDYIAQLVMEVEPVDTTLEARTADNLPVYALKLATRRKSGKCKTYNFVIDSVNSVYTERTAVEDDDEPLMNDLTTFNLGTSSRQKEAREQVELPFMEAQTTGAMGGAIVYQFEEDDDYDEEDPYEDPF